MARYTNLLTATIRHLPTLNHLVTQALEACNCRVVHQTGDYLAAKEAPGNVPFLRLVMVEVLFDRPRPTNQDSLVELTIVAKNEELPLHAENHCQQMFDEICQGIQAALATQTLTSHSSG